jgi:hypothetical protein
MTVCKYKIAENIMASTKRGKGKIQSADEEEEDVEMRPSHGGGGSPVKINYELYNEEFGDGSSGNFLSTYLV